MNNETLIRCLIRSSIQRAVTESVAALVVLIAFLRILLQSEVGSPQYFGCLLILVSTGFITGVVWSFSLSFQLLQSHPPTDVSFWREAFRAQARLLRCAPFWYCMPLCLGSLLFITPTIPTETMLSFILGTVFVSVFVGMSWLNRWVALQIEQSGRQLVAQLSNHTT